MPTDTPPVPYRTLLDRLEACRDSHQEASRRAQKLGEPQLVIAEDNQASAFAHAAAMAVHAFEGPDAAQAYAERAPQNPTEPSGHEGNDPMGAPTLHRGPLENCPAPECEDRAPEQRNEWGVHCPHGLQIVERDPDHTDPDGYPIGRLITPWPCTEDGCTAEAFEAAEQERHNDELEAISELTSDMHR